MTESLKANYAIVMTGEDQAKIIYPSNDYATSSTVKMEQNEVSKAVNALTPGNRSKEFAIKAEKQRISRRLLLTKQSQQLTVVCTETGIVSLLDVPAIYGYALQYEHPLSRLENARGIAQRGKEYLQKLNTQVLAGILITLANDYSLFRYQPSDSGAQKNAIVRSIHRDTLILAIMLIENSVHSGNHSYLPQFSMILDSDSLKRGEFDVRFQFWLQLITDCIHKPDTEQWDENETIQSKLRKEYRERNKLERDADSELRKKQRELKQDCKAAINHIKDLFKEERISAKLRGTLGIIYQEFQLLTMESAAKVLLISKLESIVHPAATALIDIAKKDRAGLVAKNTPLADFFEDAPKAEVRIVKPEGVTILKVEQPPELVAAEGQKVITIGDAKYVVDADMYSKLGFMDKIKFHKKLIAGEA